MAKKTSEEVDFPAYQPTQTVEPCVGLPVQYHQHNEVLPAVLQRRGITNPDLWDLKVSLNGATSQTTRSAVPFSETAKVGHWTFLPGFGG